MVSPRRFAFVLLMLGCGAKTGLHVPPPSESAVDDGGVGTFHCRWSLARPTVIAQGAAPTENLSFAFHPVRNEVLMVWRSADAWSGARLDLVDPPNVLERFGEEVGLDGGIGAIHGVELASPTSAWVATTGPGCQLRWLVDVPPWSEAWSVEGSTCRLEAHDSQRVDLTVIDGTAVRLWSARSLASPSVRAVARGEVRWAGSVVVDGRGWILVTVERAGVVAHRVTTDSVESFVLAPASVLDREPRLARDPLGEGAVVLWPERDGWRLGRVAFDGPWEVRALGNVGSFRTTILGTLVVTETEAMLPLSDGRVAVVPLDGASNRFLGPVSGRARVGFRPRSSVAGLAYEEEVSGEFRTLWRPLICER